MGLDLKSACENAERRSFPVELPTSAVMSAHIARLAGNE